MSVFCGMLWYLPAHLHCITSVVPAKETDVFFRAGSQSCCVWLPNRDKRKIKTPLLSVSSNQRCVFPSSCWWSVYIFTVCVGVIAAPGPAGVAVRESPVDASSLWLSISAVRPTDSADACLAINDSHTHTRTHTQGCTVHTASPTHGEIIC